MSTNEIRQSIADHLKEEPQLKGYDIQVDVQNNQVILQGIVDTLNEKQLAEQIANQASFSVENAISISTDGTAIDKNVEFEASEELNADSRVQLKNIGVDVDNGTARLVGHTDSQEELKAAQEAASRSRGVKRVLNQVKMDDDGKKPLEAPHNAAEAKKRGLDD